MCGLLAAMPPNMPPRCNALQHTEVGMVTELAEGPIRHEDCGAIGHLARDLYSSGLWRGYMDEGVGLLPLFVCPMFGDIHF